MINILHTSDWHIGRMLYGRNRYDEHAQFLDWLLQCLEKNEVDVLLVAGDIFDTTTPSHKAQALYYRFLSRVSQSRCRHVVIIGGNHDSPTFLNAPRALLSAMDVHVIGSAAQDPEEEIFVLRNESGKPELVVCAVPYLRDRDIRTTTRDESVDEKSIRLKRGIQDHYAAVFKKALALRKSQGDVPVIAMGHLFAAGGKTIADDGVRDLYVGDVTHVGTDIFSPEVDYTALGHLHIPQTVGASDSIRYSGSPIPMGFGEAGQEKQVVLITINGPDKQIRSVSVPMFRELKKIKGTTGEILKKIDELKQNQSTAWVEIEYTGNEVAQDLKEQVQEQVADSALEVLRIKNTRLMEKVMRRTHKTETLEHLDEIQVFERLLDARNIDRDERRLLKDAYREILVFMQEKDENAD